MRWLSLLLVVLLGGCAAAPIKVKSTYPEEGYKLLTVKVIPHNWYLMRNYGEEPIPGCIAVFKKGDILYAVHRVTETPVAEQGKWALRIAVYDMRNNVAVGFQSHETIADPTCLSPNYQIIKGFAGNWVWGFQRSHYWGYRTDYRKTIDKDVKNYATDPKALRSVALRLLSGFNGPKFAHWFWAVNETPNADSIPALAAWVQANGAAAKQKFARQVAAKKAAKEAAVRRAIAKKDAIRRNFRHASDQSQYVGEDVCTGPSNLFGNIQQIANGQVRVYVIGQVSGGKKYYFFRNHKRTRLSGPLALANGQFEYTKVDDYRWFDSSEIGRCQFGN